jgi:hypothetical protein
MDSSNVPSAFVEILQDVIASVAGAACLLGAGAPAEDVACAKSLLVRARESAYTLREVINHA